MMKFLRNVSLTLLVLLLFTPTATTLAAELDVGVWGGGGCCSGYTRGYWFVAPVDITITGLSVPTNGPGTGATLEVVRFDSTPPEYSSTTNNFTQLSYWSGFTTTTANIPVNAGDIIGIFGWADGQTPYRDAGGPYQTTMGGEPVTLTRLVFQDLGESHDISSEIGGTIGVIGMEYQEGSSIPTLSEWGMIILSLLMAGSAFWFIRKERHESC